MRTWVALALLLAVVPTADAVCFELGCARADDTDGDGVPDEAVVGVGGVVEQVNCNVAADAQTSWTYCEVVDEPDAERFTMLVVEAETNATASSARAGAALYDVNPTTASFDEKAAAEARADL